MAKIDSSLFDGRKSEDDEVCPKCSSPLAIKNSKNGLFIGCTDFPTCDYVKPITDTAVEVLKEIDDSSCSQCSSILQIKKGRYGLFIGCSNYPECDFTASLNESPPDVEVACPACKKGQLKEKTNKYGKRFFSCSHYPKCRYVINSQPIAKSCPDCGWPILIKKANRLQCPQKMCRYSVDDQSN